jgi:hypothetical protein
MIDLLAILLAIHFAALRLTWQLRGPNFRRALISWSIAEAVFFGGHLASLPGAEILVKEVVPGGPAWRAGVRSGSRLRELRVSREGSVRGEIAGEGRFEYQTPAWLAPWWMPVIAGEELDRFGGFGIRSYPPVLEGSVLPQLKNQNFDIVQRVRVSAFGPSSIPDRSSVATELAHLGANEISGLQFYKHAMNHHAWVAGKWLVPAADPERRAALFGLGGLGAPVAFSFFGDWNFFPGAVETYGIIAKVNGHRSYSALPFLASPSSPLHREIWRDLETTSVPDETRLALSPIFVEGPRTWWLEPAAFSVRLFLAPPAPFLRLYRLRRYLPDTWYEIPSGAPITLAYWLFRLGCAFVAVGWFWVARASLTKVRSYPTVAAWGRNRWSRSAICVTVLALSILALRDIFLILYV